MPEATAKPLLLLWMAIRWRSKLLRLQQGRGRGASDQRRQPTSVTYGFLKALLDNSNLSQKVL